MSTVESDLDAPGGAAQPAPGAHRQAAPDFEHHAELPLARKAG